MTRSMLAALGLTIACLAAGCGDSEPSAGPSDAGRAESSAVNAQSAAKDRQSQIEKVRAAIAGPGLVIEANGKPAVAIRYDGKPGSRAGKAYPADAGPARDVQLNVLSPKEGPVVACSFRDATTRPGDSMPRRDESRFAATVGADGGVVLRDPAGRTLRTDAAACSAIIQAFVAAEKVRRAPIEALHARLGGAATLTRQTAIPNDLLPLRATLLRVPGQDEYDLNVSPRASPGAHALNPAGTYRVRIDAAGKATLAREDHRGTTATLVETADDASSLTLSPIGKVSATRWRIAEVLTPERLEANLAALRAMFADLSNRPMRFSGTLARGPNLYPIRVVFNANTNGTILKGQFWSAAKDAWDSVSFLRAATPAGFDLQLGDLADAGRAGPSIDDLDRSGLAELTIADGQPIIASRILSLRPSAPERVAALRTMLDAHIARGGTFAWDTAGQSAKRGAPATLKLRADAGTIAGQASFPDGPPARAEGTASADDDFARLALKFDPTPSAKSPVTLDLYVLPRGDSFVLAGYLRNPPDEFARYVCYAPTSP